MKKTLTVNLGGSVFHIDEDAYQLLDKYLTNLRAHFQKEEGSDEIMGDFESRISELFSERIRLGYEVITIEQVEEVIRRMGKPEEIFDEEERKGTPEEEASAQAAGQASTARRRLMRDPDNRILGGVAGGFAAYLGWDATWVRVAFFVLMFFYGITIPLYCLLWIIIPMARTATEKLEMRGQNVTVENIGKTVTDGFEKATDRVNDYLSSDKPRNLIQKIADMFILLIGFFLKFCLIIGAILLLPPLAFTLFLLVVITIGLIAGGTGVLYHLSPFGMDLLSGVPEPLAITGAIGLILLIGIPVFSLIYGICGQIFKLRPIPTPVKWALLVLWIIALTLCVVYIDQSGMLYDWHHYWSRDAVWLP